MDLCYLVCYLKKREKEKGKKQAEVNLCDWSGASLTVHENLVIKCNVKQQTPMDLFSLLN